MKMLARLVVPLKPASNDPVDHEPPFYSAVLLLVILLSTVGTYLLGLVLAPYGLDYIVSSVPFFFIMIGTEALLLHLGAVKDSVAARYSVCDTWSSLCAGISQMIWFTFIKRFFSHAVLYTVVWERYRIYNLADESAAVWCACFVVGDFVYYWFHRMAHEYSPLWAGHNVHHSSEHYNLSTALRQSWRQALLSPFWSLPFALFLPPSSYFLASQWVTIYQFWVHTCIVRRLGVLEYVINTPSHHRCHHDRRLHKNFAGVFIVWDRMFNTFQDELALTDDLVSTAPEDRVRGEASYFGIKEVVTSWSEPSVQLMLVLKTRSWWRGPGYDTSTALRPLPKYAPAHAIPRLRLSERFSTTAKVYLSVQLVMAFSLFIVLVADQPKWPRWQDAAILTAFLIASLTSQGNLLDGGRGVWYAEIARCVVAVFLFESWSWYSLSWFHVASLVVVLVKRHTVQGPLTTKSLKGKRS
jgi:alkylglycerol monooxygenase